jgi:enoyl-CoA hydratase
MSEVRVEVTERVAVLTLDAPERRNALTLPMVAEIAAAMDEIEGKGDASALVVTGAPPAFCAGATLAHLGSSAAEEEDRPAGLLAIYEGFLRIGRSPLPTIAAVNGAAVGAGLNLALVCDVRLAARRARFDTRFLQLGLHPGGGHTWMLQRAAGLQAAAAAVLFGEVLDASAAERCGLVWRCVDDDALLDEATALAARAAEAPPALARRVKATLTAMAGVTNIRTAVEVELEAQLWSIGQPDFAERLAALQAKITSRH